MASKRNKNGGVCSAFGCSKRRGTNILSQVKMFNFPKDPDRRVAWTNADIRENWTPTRNSLLSNAHFISGKPSQDRQHPDYVPSVSQFALKNKPIEQGQKSIKRYERSVKRIRHDSVLETLFTNAASKETDENMHSSLDVSSSSRNNKSNAAVQTDFTAEDFVILDTSKETDENMDSSLDVSSSSRNNKSKVQTDFTAEDFAILDNSLSFENVSSIRQERIPAYPKSLAECGQCLANNQTNQNVLTQQLFNLIKELRTECAQIDKKLDILIERNGNRQCDASAVAVLPPDVELPLQSEEDLESLNARLKTDEELSSIMVKFLYDSGYGKTASSFVHNITKKVLSQELAKKYSRCGRKGKKSFLPFTNVLNVILAAAAKQFPRQEKHSLVECFGKSLANASEWNGRTKQETMEKEDTESNRGFY